jgi:site-specific DNA recombinase
MTTARTAVGYVRVSTAYQVEDGVSLDAQEERLRSWAAANGYDLVAVYRDEGVSGKRADNRPGLQRALSEACKSKGVLVTFSLSRLARSTRDAIDIAERLEKCGAELASLSERIDTTSASGRAFFRIMAVIAEFERDQTSERTKMALSHIRKSGRKTGGSVPYGYRLAADGRSLVREEREQRALALLRALKADGLSLRSIGARLEAAGYGPRSGGSWNPKVVRALSQRAA